MLNCIKLAAVKHFYSRWGPVMLLVKNNFSVVFSIRFFALALILCALSAVVFAEEKPSESAEFLRQAEQHLAAGDTERALNLLLEHEYEFAGLAEYDYLLGLAAVRSNKAALGLFALDRLLLANPLHAGGRLERAIALVQLGQFEQADLELAQLEEMSPPPEAAKVIRKYRDRLSERKRLQSEPSHSFMITGGLGHDSNVNSAPADYNVELFGGLFQTTISGMSGTFADLQAQYVGRFPLNSDNNLQFSAGIQERLYDKSALEQFNLSVLQGSASWQHKLSQDRSASGSVQFSQVYTDTSREKLLNMLTLKGQLEQPVLQSSRLSSHAILRNASYADLDHNDYDSLGVGASVLYPMSAVWDIRFTTELEREFASAERDGGDAWRGKLKLVQSFAIAERQKLQLELEYRKVLYDDKGFAFYNKLSNAYRDDDLISGAAVFSWLIRPEWYFTGELKYRDQSSNIDFFNSDQFVAGLNITYLWR